MQTGLREAENILPLLHVMTDDPNCVAVSII